MTKFKKNTHTHLSLSPYLPIRRCTLIFPERMCMHQSLSLSFSIYNCKNGLDPDQTRKELREERFANLKKLHYAKCRTKADAHDNFQYIHWSVPCRTGVKGSGPPPPENHKNIEYPSNTGPDPLKFSKLPSQHSTLGHHRHPSETPFKWRFAGGPMMARFCDIL